MSEVSKLVQLQGRILSLSKTLVFCSSYFGILIFFFKYCTNNYLDGWVFLTTSEILRQRLAALQSQPLNSLAKNQFRPQLATHAALPQRERPAPGACSLPSPPARPRAVPTLPAGLPGSAAGACSVAAPSSARTARGQPRHGGLRVAPLLPPALRPVAAKTLGSW